jgi:hypothetical protein
MATGGVVLERGSVGISYARPMIAPSMIDERKAKRVEA